MADTNNPSLSASDGLTDRQRNELDKQVNVLKNLYTTRRRAMPGAANFKLTPKLHTDTFWVNLVTKLNQHDICMSDYVDFVFRRHAPRPPFPQHLGSNDAIHKFVSSNCVATLINEANIILESTSRAVNADIHSGRPVPETLDAVKDTANPLYVYCMAVLTGYTELADSFKAVASEFLHKHPYYRKTTLAEYIPEDL